MRFSCSLRGYSTLHTGHRVRVNEVDSVVCDKPLYRSTSRLQRPKETVKMTKTPPPRRHKQIRNPVNQRLHENRDSELGSRFIHRSVIRNNQERRVYASIDCGEKSHQSPLGTVHAGVVGYEKDPDGFLRNRRVIGPNLWRIQSHLSLPRLPIRPRGHRSSLPRRETTASANSGQFSQTTQGVSFLKSSPSTGFGVETSGMPLQSAATVLILRPVPAMLGLITTADCRYKVSRLSTQPVESCVKNGTLDSPTATSRREKKNEQEEIKKTGGDAVFRPSCIFHFFRDW